MLTLEQDTLKFKFPEVHEEARTEINLQITLRIPDDTKEYPLPPGLGRFPLRHTEDFRGRVPAEWIMRGGVMLPMFKTEAMWLAFDNARGRYPCAIKIACGKINAISGKPWKAELDAADTDYLVVPGQPWLDGFAVGKGQIRQFVAMPLGGGYTAEEQITGKAEWGGLQIIVYPMKRERWEKIQAEEELRRKLQAAEAKRAAGSVKQSFTHGRSKVVLCVSKKRRIAAAVPPPAFGDFMHAAAPICETPERRAAPTRGMEQPAPAAPVAMGLGAGGRMRQEIYRDPYGIEAWDQSVSSRCFLTLVDAGDWVRITGEKMRRKPPSAQTYAEYGLPWFDYEAPGREALAGAPELSMLKTVGEVAEGKGLDPLPGNETVDPAPLVKLGP